MTDQVSVPPSRTRSRGIALIWFSVVPGRDVVAGGVALSPPPPQARVQTSSAPATAVADRRAACVTETSGSAFGEPQAEHISEDRHDCCVVARVQMALPSGAPLERRIHLHAPFTLGIVKLVGELLASRPEATTGWRVGRVGDVAPKDDAPTRPFLD